MRPSSLFGGRIFVEDSSFELTCWLLCELSTANSDVADVFFSC